MTNLTFDDVQAEYDRLALEVAGGNAAAKAQLEELEQRLIDAETEVRRQAAADRARVALEADKQRERDAAEAKARRARVRKLRDRYAQHLTRLDEAAKLYMTAVRDLTNTGRELFNEGEGGHRPAYDAQTSLQVAALRDLPDHMARRLGSLIGSPPADLRQQVAIERGLLSNPSPVTVFTEDEFLDEAAVADVVRTSVANDLSPAERLIEESA